MNVIIINVRRTIKNCAEARFSFNLRSCVCVFVCVELRKRIDERRERMIPIKKGHRREADRRSSLVCGNELDKKRRRRNGKSEEEEEGEENPL